MLKVNTRPQHLLDIILQVPGGVMEMITRVKEDEEQECKIRLHDFDSRYHVWLLEIR